LDYVANRTETFNDFFNSRRANPPTVPDQKVPAVSGVGSSFCVRMAKSWSFILAS
jgi:hypothetical protein